MCVFSIRVCTYTHQKNLDLIAFFVQEINNFENELHVKLVPSEHLSHLEKKMQRGNLIHFEVHSFLLGCVPRLKYRTILVVVFPEDLLLQQHKFLMAFECGTKTNHFLNFFGCALLESHKPQQSQEKDLNICA